MHEIRKKILLLRKCCISPERERKERVDKINNFRLEKRGKKLFCWAFLRIVDYLTISVEKGSGLLYTEIVRQDFM